MPAVSRKVSMTMSEAQKNLPAVLDQAESGKVISITRRGRIVAEIRPAADAKAGGHRLPFGCMAGTGQIRGDITASLESEWE